MNKNPGHVPGFFVPVISAAVVRARAAAVPGLSLWCQCHSGRRDPWSRLGRAAAARQPPLRWIVNLATDRLQVAGVSPGERLIP